MTFIKELDLLSINSIHPNSWNPNVQSTITFNNLVERIRELGFEDPLKVAPCNCSEIEGEHFVTIGGEHRLKAAKVLSYTEIPCFVHKDWNEQKQRLETVRDNVIKGDLDDRKFTALVKSLNEEYELTHEDIQKLMGFESVTEYTKHILKEKTKKERRFIEGLMSDVKKESHAVDSLTDLISNIFATSGDTLDQNYMAFAYKGRNHYLILMNRKLYDLMDIISNDLGKKGEDMAEFIRVALEEATKIKD